MLFEDALESIEEEIQKRRSRWTLTAIRYMDFDDVAQILRIHISDKWHLYDAEKPLKPWLSKVISHRMINLIRDHYGRYARPCVQCESSGPENSCDIYGTQCSDCPAFKIWQENKKDAFNIKMPSFLEADFQEVNNKQCEYMDYSLAVESLSAKMKDVLKPVDYKIYKFSYIDNLSDDEIVKLLGYKTENRTRSRGVKYVKDAKKTILEAAKKILEEGDVPYCF